MPDESIQIPIDLVDSPMMAKLKQLELTAEKSGKKMSESLGVKPRFDVVPVQSGIFKLKKSTEDFIHTMKNSFDPAVYKSFRQGKANVSDMMQVLENLREDMRLTGDPSTLHKYNRAIKDVEIGIQKATVAGVGFSNVAVSGFQKGFGVLRQMAHILPGVGISGIILAGWSLLTRSISQGKKELEEAANNAQKLKDRIKEMIVPVSEIASGARGSTGGELVKVRTLSSVVLDLSKSYKERNNALLELQRINKNYFGDLTLEASKLKTLKDRVDEYSNALIAQAVVKAFLDDISKISKEFTIQSDVLSDLRKEYDDLFGLRIRATDDARITAEELSQKKQLTKRINEQQAAVTSLGEQYTKLEGQLKNAIGVSLKFKPLDGGGKDLKDESDKIIARARAFVKQFGEAFVVPDLEESFTNTKEKVLAAAKQLLSDIDAGRLKIKIQPAIEIAPFIPGETISIFDAVELQKGFFETMQKAFEEPFVPDISIDVAAFNQQMKEKLDAALKAGNFKAALDAIDIDTGNLVLDGLTDEAKNAASLINETLTPAFQNLFEAISSGENPIKAFFNSVIQSINQLIQRLIAAVVQAAILSAISGGTTSFGSALGDLIGGVLRGGGIRNNVLFAGDSLAGAGRANVEFRIRNGDLVGAMSYGQNVIGRVNG